MIIDAHNHADWMGYNFEKQVANMDEYNIDVTWILTWEAPVDEVEPNNFREFSPLSNNHPVPFSLCLSYVERAPNRFVLGYAPDPRRPDAIDKLEAAIELYGVKVYGELKLRMMYDNPDALRMFRFCAQKKLPVIVHIDYEFSSGYKYPRQNWWYGGGIDAFERAIQQCPETIFLGHGPGYWAHISGDDLYDKYPYPSGKVMPGGDVVRMLRKYPNLYCDLSASGLIAMQRDKEFAHDFFMEFQDRALYARDSFDNNHQEYFSTLGLPATVLEKVYSLNALNLVPLSIPQKNS